MKPLSPGQLLALVDQLTETELTVVDLVARFRLVQSSQVERLFFQQELGREAAGRRCRRQLARLADLGLLRRLDRRVGGVRAGSAGHILCLAPAGRRLHALTHGHEQPSNRGVHEPGLAFVTHTLAITDFYVSLREAERTGALELLEFATEPDCWRPYTLVTGSSGFLKPDAFVRLGIGAWEERSFVEVDLATEGRGALTRKIRAYLAYQRSGREQATDGVFPRIVFLTTSHGRARQITAVSTRIGVPDGLLLTGTLNDTVAILTGGATEEHSR